MVVVISPAMATAIVTIMVMAAEMGADADSSDMDADSDDIGARGGRSQERQCEQRCDEHFHETIPL